MRGRRLKYLATALMAAGLALAGGAVLAQSGAIYPDPKEP